MKTTIEISENILKSAKKYAADKGLTLNSVIESALRNMLENNPRPMKFTLKDGSVAGQGLSPEYSDASRNKIRNDSSRY